MFNSVLDKNELITNVKDIIRRLLSEGKIKLTMGNPLTINPETDTVFWAQILFAVQTKNNSCEMKFAFINKKNKNSFVQLL